MTQQPAGGPAPGASRLSFSPAATIGHYYKSPPGGGGAGGVSPATVMRALAHRMCEQVRAEWGLGKGPVAVAAGMFAGGCV